MSYKDYLTFLLRSGVPKEIAIEASQMYYKKEGRMRQALVKHVLDLNNYQNGHISERDSVEEAESHRGKLPPQSCLGFLCSEYLMDISL